MKIIDIIDKQYRKYYPDSRFTHHETTTDRRTVPPQQRTNSKTNIIFILSHIAYRKDQFICPVPWTHEELIYKWDRETIMREKIQKR